MMRAGNLVICAVLLIGLAACSSNTSRQDNSVGQSPGQLTCSKTSPGDNGETDGGVGGTGKQPDECIEERKSE